MIGWERKKIGETVKILEKQKQGNAGRGEERKGKEGRQEKERRKKAWGASER
jgi:hypothetical protein